MKLIKLKAHHIAIGDLSKFFQLTDSYLNNLKKVQNLWFESGKADSKLYFFSTRELMFHRLLFFDTSLFIFAVTKSSRSTTTTFRA